MDDKQYIQCNVIDNRKTYRCEMLRISVVSSNSPAVLAVGSGSGSTGTISRSSFCVSILKYHPQANIKLLRTPA